MSQLVPEQHPLRLLFREATDWAFRHGQLPEPSAQDARLKDYLSDDLLVRFLHVDRLWRIYQNVGADGAERLGGSSRDRPEGSVRRSSRLRDSRDRPLADVAEMLLSGEAVGMSPELRALAVQRHIGDYTLFITGLFPESLERVRRDWQRKDSVLMQLGSLVVPFRDPQGYYEEAGRRAYRSAAEIGREMELAEAELFEKLSRFFRAYVQLMSLVRIYLDASPAFGEYGGVLS